MPRFHRVSLAEALDGNSLAWTNIGTSPWIGQSSVTHDGQDAAVSGAIPNSMAVTIQTIVTGAGTVGFWWKVSSEANADYLKFFVDGVQQTRISGEVDWQSQSFAISSGVHVFLIYFLSANNSSLSRTGIIYLGAQTFAVAQSGNGGGTTNTPPTNPPACTFVLSATSATLPANSSTGLVSVTAGSNCLWTVFNTNPWIGVINSTNIGTGFVRYILPVNNGVESRTGIFRIDGQWFTVTQLGAQGPTNPPPNTNPPCAFVLSATSATLPANSATGLVTVATGSNCLWTVFNTNTWIGVANSTNFGSGFVCYFVTPNNSAESRTGIFPIAGQWFAIHQAGTPPTIRVLPSIAGSTSLEVTAHNGVLHVIEVSDDLVHWAPIRTNDTPATFTDLSCTNKPLRFYRVYEISAPSGE